MRWTVADRDSVKAAILLLVAGARVVRVTVNNKTIEYGQNQLNDLRALLAEMDADLENQSGKPRVFLTRTSKGL